MLNQAVAKISEISEVERLEKTLHEIEYEKVSSSKIIGLNSKGNPVIKSDFVKRIGHSLLAVENGEWISLEELETRSENW